MAYRTKNPDLLSFYEKMLALAQDVSSELYFEGCQRTGAGHRCAFWDGYNGVSPSPHVIPGTLSAAAAAAGRDFRKQHTTPVPMGSGYVHNGVGQRSKGRPPLQEDERRSCTIRVRATQAEVLAFEKLGGVQWLRGQLALRN